jgi:hypothetical protein
MLLRDDGFGDKTRVAGAHISSFPTEAGAPGLDSET